jgi:hypothetical protein
MAHGAIPLYSHGMQAERSENSMQKEGYRAKDPQLEEQKSNKVTSFNGYYPYCG